MTDKVLAIIQARIGSTRLPCKVLLPLAGKSALEHVIMRVKRSEEISEVIVATSTKEDDIKIVEFCEELNVRTFRGSEEDVLDRFYQASKLLKPVHVVRITADCPMIDPKIISEIVLEHLKGGSDYTSNTIEPTYPDGEDVEVFKASALEKAWKSAKLSSEREHVTPYIKNNPHVFKLMNVVYKYDLSGKRWTLDEKKDYEFLKKVFDGLYPLSHFFGMEDVVAFLKKNPKVEYLNSTINRNEGYQKSLKNDRVIKA
jgi:spore coat polysaccharide biosynthesis protein SpsF